MAFSHNNTILWSAVFISIGALKIISSVFDLFKGERHKKTRSYVFGIILGIVIVICGILPLMGIGSFVPCD